MNDRELLEFAAKAAGMWKDCFALDDDYLPEFNEDYGLCLSYNTGWWNPLTDDGDALRLATKLMMSISLGPIRVQACTIEGALRGNFFQEDIIEKDMYVSTRLVIVRAAAEIGKAIP